MEEFYTLDTASTGEFFPECIFFLKIPGLLLSCLCVTQAILQPSSVRTHGI